MTENFEEKVNKLAEQLEKTVEAFGKLNDTTEKSEEQKQKELEDSILQAKGYRKVNGNLISIEEERIKTEKKLSKELEATFGKAAIQNKKQQAEFEKQVQGMGYIIKSNGEFVKSTVELTKQQKKILSELKIADAPGKAFGELADKLNSTKAITGEFSNKILEATKGSMGLTASYKLLIAGFEGIFNATKVMTKSLYDGERGAKVGAKAISEFADSISTAMKGIGAAMMFIPGLGIAARIAGGAIALLGQAAQTAADANKVAAEQNDKLFDSFNKLSEAGLAGAQGMTGVFKTVQTLGMTTAELEKFNELLKSNSKDLKMFGSTTAAGAEKFADVAGELVKSEVGQKLEMLGVTADAQREHTLKYMAQQTRMGMMQGKSQQDLVKGAAAYVEELDKLSMLTGATRKEQEDARAAVMAEEELRAAMLQAELDGDKQRQQQLKSMADYATYLRTVGDTRGATGVAKYAAAGGPIDEASAAAMITYGKGIEAALNGKPIAEVIKQGNESSKDILKQMAGTKAVGGDISGLVTGKTGTMIDTTKMVDEAVKLQEKTGKTFDEALKQIQEERRNTDQRTKDNVEATRKQQDAAQKLDSVVWTFNAAAKLNKDASDIFNSAVTKFNNTVGAQPVAGGNIRTTMTGGGGGAAAPAGAPVSMSTTGGGAATGNPNLTRQSARSRGVDIGQPPTPGPGVNVASTARGLPATQSADDVMKLIKFQGDALGNRSHFDALDPYVKQKFMDMIAEYGKPVQINAAMRDMDEQQTLYDKWIANGKLGNPVAKPGSSKHNFGRALDLNSSQVADLSASGLLSKYGFNTIKNDPPHIEMARFGGVFSGPESGYPVMLHGDQETVVTKPQFDEMASNVKKESVTTAFSNLGSDSTAPIDSPTEILKELVGLMEDKFDAMLGKLSTSNDLQLDLLKHSRV